MARPPIIISNGGVLDELTKPGKILMEAIRELNTSGRATVSRIDCENVHAPVPKLIWHLKSEKENVINPLLENMYPNKNATLGKEIK